MSLLKSTFTVSLLTLLSRITGLVREIMIARLFGVSVWTDAFNVAFRLPNLLRRLFAEGAFSQAFVPLLNHSLQHDGPERSQAFVAAVAKVLFWVLTLVCVLGVVAAPWLTWLIASGLSQAGFDAATWMVRLMFPYIGLISLVSLASALLNAHKHFVIPAAAPILLNICMVIGGFWFSQWTALPIYGLAFGVMLGGLMQCAWLWWALAKYAFRPRIFAGASLASAWREPAVREVLRKMLPAVLAVSVAQISLILNTQIATHLASGSVSWLSYADRIMEFPTALLGVAIGVVLLPQLSRSVAAQQFERFASMLDWGLRLVVILALPCSLALLIFAKPIVTMLFQHGLFHGGDTRNTAAAVAAYGVGLLGIISIKILAPGFYALKDTSTPAKIAVWVLLATQAMNLLLVPWLGHVGLALSISLGAWLNAGLLFRGLYTRGMYQLQAGWSHFVRRIVIALLPTALLLTLANQIDFAAYDFLQRSGLVLAVSALAAATYFVTLRLQGMHWQELRSPPNL